MAFVKGQSGNPSGRPKIAEEVRQLAAAKTDLAFKKIVLLLDSKDERVQLAAAQEIINRAAGKPTEPKEVSGTIQYEHVVREAREYLANRVSSLAARRAAANGNGVAH